MPDDVLYSKVALDDHEKGSDPAAYQGALGRRRRTRALALRKEPLPLWRKHRIVLIWAVGAAAMAVLSLIVVLLYTSGRMNRSLSAWDHLPFIDVPGEAGAPGIGLFVTPATLDLDAHTLTANWYPVACNQTGTTFPPVSYYGGQAPLDQSKTRGCGNTSSSINIWVDGQPLWTWNASDIHTTGGNRYRTLLPARETFTTTHGINLQTFALEHPRSRTATYPFDWHMAATEVEAFDAVTNASIPIFFLQNTGGVTGYWISRDVGRISTVRGSGGIEVAFFVNRPVSLALFTMVLFATNYALALGMLYIAIAAALNENIGSELLLLPVSVMLALPSIRAAMPGTPSDFGTFIDLAGYEVNLFATVVTAIALVFALVKRSGENKSA